MSYTVVLVGTDFDSRQGTVFERFHNPEIRHELKSIALNSTSKFRARLLPTLLDRYHSTGKIPTHLAHAFAALIVFYRGKWRGESLPVSDHPDALKAFELCGELDAVKAAE